MIFPKEIEKISENIKEAGFKAYLVGGSLRDLLLKREPKDWDIATNARPEEIQKIFPDSVYENNFGTVAVKSGSDDPRLKIIEITTFRLEGKYTDLRHPNEIKFAETIKEDLSRRDFTINSIALDLSSLKTKKSESIASDSLVDPFGGLKDLDKKIIRAVGLPDKRFSEDALRLLRAVRFSSELDFVIEDKTFSSLKKNSKLLKKISEERIREEFEKMIMSPGASKGLILLRDSGLLEFVLPELLEGDKISQNKHHIYDVFEHSLRSLDYAVKKDFNLELRLAALLHDIGKPRVKKGSGENATFYAHEIVGAKMASAALLRLCFSKKIIDKVRHLVRFHMFNYAVGEVTDAGVRRLVARVGLEHLDDLIKLREADRIGSGVPKALPYKLRHLLYMIEKVRHDPISPKNLKINGHDLMKLLKINPSPKIGMILNALLDEVMEAPEKNDKKILEKRAKELNKLSDEELAALMVESKKKQAAFEAAVDEEIKSKHYIK
ncbi:MAG: HD domain-containing protein [Candidatus Pacebacteria bacterium]|nr:HD domain-containing protein [Candidatus Paceibacterota bacterium]